MVRTIIVNWAITHWEIKIQIIAVVPFLKIIGSILIDLILESRLHFFLEFWNHKWEKSFAEFSLNEADHPFRDSTWNCNIWLLLIEIYFQILHYNFWGKITLISLLGGIDIELKLNAEVGKKGIHSSATLHL